MCSVAGSPALIQSLLAAGAFPNAQDELGNTATLIAAMKGRTDVVKVLLDGRADPNTPRKVVHSSWHVWPACPDRAVGRADGPHASDGRRTGQSHRNSEAPRPARRKPGGQDSGVPALIPSWIAVVCSYCPALRAAVAGVHDSGRRGCRQEQ